LGLDTIGFARTETLGDHVQKVKMTGRQPADCELAVVARELHFPQFHVF
jgi:hypothetical protein